MHEVRAPHPRLRLPGPGAAGGTGPCFVRRISCQPARPAARVGLSGPAPPLQDPEGRGAAGARPPERAAQ